MRQPPKKFRAVPYEWQEIIEVEIEALSNLGSGIARPDGWVVFIPFTLPGEKISARVWRNEKNCSHADLVDILEPSPHRQAAPCPHFGTCGGCQYQNFPYEEQLRWKTRQVADLLKHMVGHEHPVHPAIPSPRQYAYRSKLTPHFQKPKNGERPSIGFLEHNRRSRLVDIEHCPIAMEEINEALPRERENVFQNADSYKHGATILLRATEGKVETNPRSPVTEHVGDLTFHFLAGDFFQNNPFILPAFPDYVAEQAKAGGQRFLLDAYCGSGLFALALARHFEKVTGIEVSESSADWARRNAETNKIKNANFITASAEKLFDDISDPADETTVIIDPPRKGSSTEFLNQLFTYLPSRVVYISCNPATQMRDLIAFIDADYKIDTIQPFDLFPQTRHLECVITLTR